MNVLSLFDGMSCGQIALNRSGVKYDNYFASEIKKHAINVTQANYPDTIQVGDVTKLDVDKLPVIDLLIGGSPCQDFSRGHAERDGLNGQKSSLFYEYVRIYEALKKRNPNLKFLLENVIMPKSDEGVISKIFDTDPIRINSALVSAQMRDRLYWTNIGPMGADLFGRKYSEIPQPKDRHIFLQDILEDGRYTDRQKSRALLESDSRPLRTPEKMWHRYSETCFTTLVFDDPACDWQKGISYMTQAELERCQTVPAGYTKILKRDKAACLLGDGWTVDVICIFFDYLKKGKT